jgi:ribonucleotide reductase beta subunit family protein with ferritin-like domain
MRHQYRVLSDEEKKAMQAIKDAGLSFLNTLDLYVQPGRELSIAKTKTEEAVMWAVKSITA